MTKSTSWSPWKRSGPLAVALAGLAIAGTAAAQPSGPEPAAVVLRWSAPAECPTGDQVLEDARTLASSDGGHRDATAPRRPITVDALVERLAGGRWSVTLAIGAAQQRLEASSCAQLARASALFLALVVDPSRGDPQTPVADAGPPPPPAPVPAAGGARRAVSVLAAAGLVLESGTLPRAEPLGALEVGIRYRRMELSVQATVGPAQEKMISGTVGARLQPQSATLTPCYALLVVGRVRFGPCAWGEVGWLHAEGIGVSRARVANSAWLSLGGELAAWLALGASFEVRAGAGALVPVVHPDFALTGLGSVFESGIAVRAGLAAVIRF